MQKKIIFYYLQNLKNIKGHDSAAFSVNIRIKHQRQK